jgi:hypothetical protein
MVLVKLLVSTGIGATVTVNCCAAPKHPLKDGVIE